MSIRIKILGLVVILGTLLAISNLIRAYDYLMEEIDYRRAAVINQLSNELLTSAGSWAVERGTSATVLGNPSASAGKQGDTIRARRERADTAFQNALAILADDPGLAAADGVNAMRSAYDAVQRLRPRMDAVLAAKSIGDDQELRKVWFSTITNLIMSSAAVRTDAEHHLSGSVEPIIVEAFVIRGASWEASEYAGRERGFMSGRIANGAQLTSRQVRLMANYQGRIDEAWSIVKSGVNAFSPAFAGAVAEVDNTFFGTFVKLRETVFDLALDASPNYPVSGQGWFDASTAGIAKILEAQSIAASEIRVMVDDHVQEALVGLIVQIALFFVSIGIMLFAWIYLGRAVVGPITRLIGTMGELASGNLDAFVDKIEGQDEIGRMGKAVYTFKQEARAAAAAQEQQAKERQEAQDQQRQAFLDLAAHLESTVGAVVQGVGSASQELTATARSVSGNAEHTRSASVDSVTAVAQASGNIHAVAEAAEQLDAAISEVSGKVVEAASVASEAAREAAETSQLVEALDGASTRITDVIKLINDIAEQTNLLALNATIEAARAGDAGKGFAVVASEVKNLATQTAKATEDIDAEISAMRSTIDQAVRAMRSIGTTIDRLNETNTAISAAVEEQAATTSDITRNMGDAARGVSDVESQITSVAEAAESTGTATSRVLASAEDLEGQSSTLSNEIDTFLRQVRAG